MATTTKTGTKRVTFTVQAEPNSQVYLAGSFNAWDSAKKAMLDKKGTGLFSAMVMLPKGTHEYKFVVNGQWQLDSLCPECAPDGFGSLNSVITVA